MPPHARSPVLGRRVFAVAPLSLLALPAWAQQAGSAPGVPSAAENAAIGRVATQFMHSFEIPGLSVAVGYDGRILYTAAWGMADKEKREPMTPDHRLRIASVSKPITSVALFTLIEQGRLALGDRVFGPGGILGSDFGGPPFRPGVERITLEHLLTHTAGGWSNDATDPMFSHFEMDHAQLIAWTLGNRPLDHPPGEQFAYSNFGYCILGRVIEKVTRQPYADFVRATVLRRCGVDGMTIAGNTLAERQAGEVRYYTQERLDPYKIDIARMDSHGGWIARPVDLVQFALHVGRFPAPAQILKPETTRVMTAPTPASGAYAKGWHVNRADNWWHEGSLPGTRAIMARIHSGFCWAACLNARPADRTANIDQLVWKMVREVKGWRV